LLFVYGTLRRGFELHPHLPRLGARYLTEAKVAAELIDRGRYPGARPSGRKGKWVRGELFELRQPADNLRVLDEVEGFIPGAPERSGFVRAAAEVILSNGARCRAWIYWLGGRPRKSTEELTWIVRKTARKT
jgi:gamma-glutamylcyclotransferase (GGCT)/AIG2-like uncharacterized protein YtfP